MSTHVLTGRWQVRDGKEDEFTSSWEAIAVLSEVEDPERSAARLLQSTEDPLLFVGLWEFPSAEAIDAWRANAAVQDRLAALDPLLERAETGVFEVRVVVG